MTPLTLDISATLFNRTAVNFLMRDTVAALGSQVAGFQFMGDRHSTATPAAPVREALLRRFEASIASGHIEARPGSRNRQRLLYFDPLYTLFGELDERDTVFVLDLTTITNPDWHNANVSRLYEFAFRKMLRSGCRTIHISRNTLLTMRAAYGSEGAHARVIPLYVRDIAGNASGVRQHPFTLGRYLLFVGSLEVRKNITGLICAYEMSGLLRDGYRLVIAGGDGHGAAAIRSLALRTRGVHLLGYVSDGDLDHLYRHAAAFVYPSYLEGFGVPLLEAMAYGLPCLASLTGACPEVGGPEMLYVDPCDAPAIAKALVQLAAERTGAGERLRARALEQFSFERYFEALREALD